MPPSQLLLLSLPLLLPRASDPSYLRMLLLPLDARARPRRPFVPIIIVERARERWAPFHAIFRILSRVDP